MRARAERTSCTSARLPASYRPKPRLPLPSYIQRSRMQLDQRDKNCTDKIHHSRVVATPPGSPKSTQTKSHEGSYADNDFCESYMRRERSDLFEEEELYTVDNSNRDVQKKKGQQLQAQSHFKTASPGKRNVSSRREVKSSKSYPPSKISGNEDINSFSWLPISVNSIMSRGLLIVASFILMYMLCPSTGEKYVQNIDNSNSLLFRSIEEVRAKFHNQDLDTWNDISSAINEMISRNCKVPSIILLYANETDTMNCLAGEIARISSRILHIDSPMQLSPEDFGDDAGEIINELNQTLRTKKVAVIRDILNINAKAIRALHNLCDRENPLVGEIIYILTMQINNYELSQKKLAFVEKQIYHKLSKSIDQDTLSALVTRITDGAIIAVQPEPHLRYCV